MGSATVPLPLAKESNFGGPMKKRGRPKTNGGKPPWVLRRITWVVYAYDRARKAGEKHAAAVDEAVKFVQTRKANDVTGKLCTRWNERESTWRKSGSCQS